MERLSDTAIEIINDLHTERLEYASEYIPLIDAANRLAAYEDTGMEPEDLKKAFNETAILKLAAQVLRTTPDHLRDLLQAEQDGRLVVLPCKVGDTVYQIDAERVYESEVKRIIFDCDDIAFDERAIGGSIFLTREDAEAALKGGEDHRENRPD